MKLKPGLIAGLLGLLMCLMGLEPKPTQAQSPVDDQLVKAMQAMKSTWTECSNHKFFECIANLGKNGYRVTGTLNRQVNKGTEAIDIEVGGNLTPADAQRSFTIEADSYRTSSTHSTPAPQFWRTETFVATPGQKDSGVLEASLASDPGVVNGVALGFLVCGNLTANLNMLLFAPPGASRDKALVDLTQSRLKGLMVQLGQALSGAGACAGGGGPLRPLALAQFAAGGDYKGGAGVLTTKPYSQIVSVIVGEPAQNGEVKVVSGVTVKLFYDGTLVNTQQTNASGGYADFGTAWLPQNTPKGRSQHQLKVQASKEGFAPVEASKQIEVQNGLEQTKILVKPVNGTYQANQSVTIEGQVFVAGALWGTTPVPARVTVSQASASAGGDTALGETTTLADGSFSLVVQLGKSRYPVAVLAVQALATQPDQFEDASTEVNITMEKGKQLLVTLGTDKGAYAQGDTVAVQGSVTSEGNPVPANIQVFVDGVSQGVQTAGSDGTFQAAFVPPALPGQLPAPGGQHLVVVNAQATGYEDGAATAYFLVGGEALACVPLPLDVLNVKGQPTASSLIPPNAVPPPQPSGAPKTGQTISVPKASLIVQGNKLTQDMSVRTGANDQVVLSLPLEAGGEVRIAVDAGTELKIGSFCKDASGKVKLLLYLDNPGKILINIDNPQGGAAPLDYKIITPRTAVTSVNTRYVVAVDEQGATTVASFEGIVLVSDLQAANTAQVQPAQQLTVPIGKSPNQVQPAARSLALDAGLEALLGQASPAASSSPLPTGMPRDATAAAQAQTAAPSPSPSPAVALGLGVVGLLLVLFVVFIVVRRPTH